MDKLIEIGIGIIVLLLIDMKISSVQKSVILSTEILMMGLIILECINF